MQGWMAGRLDGKLFKCVDGGMREGERGTTGKLFHLHGVQAEVKNQGEQQRKRIKNERKKRSKEQWDVWSMDEKGCSLSLWRRTKGQK